MLERLSEHDFQFVAMDPEGDCGDLGDAVAIGQRQRRAAGGGDAGNPAQDCQFGRGEPAEREAGGPSRVLAGLLPELLVHWEATGRPHFVMAGEAHHMPPATRDSGTAALPSGLRGFMFVTVRPEALPPRTLGCVDRALAVGDEAWAAPALFAWAHGLAEPDGAEMLERGGVSTVSRTDPAARRFKVVPGKSGRRRHLRRYAEGKLGGKGVLLPRR